MRSNLAEVTWIGILSGIVSGFFLGILIFLLNSPFILEAEKFETQTSPLKTHVDADLNVHGQSQHTHSHTNGPHTSNTLDKFKLQDEAYILSKRNLWTIFGSILLGIGFGILCALWTHFLPPFSVEGKESLLKVLLNSILFAVSGFLIFFGIPAMGLPPELPGRLAGEADYGARQTWWYFCVLSCSCGFAFFSGLLAYSKRGEVWKWGLGLAVLFASISLPFLSGAPILSEESITPLDLRSKFETISWIVNFLFWLVLSLCFFLLQRKRSLPISDLGRA
ncbi:CbtA family protein [Leptospira langatensis]|uniref:CbtA family protein n=1 Tax=Leptospira langatensis TaxID=2484983 RepID=UPI0014386757|nr:CbtA family protein [Leptospira langatensis]